MSAPGSKRVLITFARSFLTLDLARLMSAGGHDVTVVDSIPLAVTRFSNSVTSFEKVPSPTFAPREYCRELARIVRERSIDLLIPVHEETDIIAMMRDEFPDTCELFLSDFETENNLHNKYEFQRVLSEQGIPTLKFAQVRTPEELAALEFDTPFALKECYSRGSQQVYKVYPGQLPTDIEFSPGNPWIAQEWLKGTNYCTYSVCRDGEVLAHTAYPVGYAIDGRSCIAFDAIEHAGILDWVTSFVKQMNFTGQVGFDFIEDADGALFTIECNPRGTSGIMLFDPADGVDRAFTGQTDAMITPKPGTRKMIGFGMGLYGWKKSSLKGNTLRGFLRDFRAYDDVITNRDDRVPALMMPIAYLNIAKMCFTYRVGLAEAFMHDHEWDGQPI
ncbi:ATP-grasp domain-containing protein [Williamsia sp.]|uniref:ATP-grasp domain-containing protein n=1 Tax=Williamsia sp. TaxID=1872085 RepID=UPI001A338198|nr:ATP-grasp domain-containing protein [Williamsia sp.]MBJ7289806.1 carboxylate--amine ligase [Williamsia sp.]